MPGAGTVVGGKYRIERVLGTGGMGVVAAAHHLQLNRRVAIKYLLKEALEYPELIERFTREAQVAASIRGEHVARVIDIGVFDDGAPYIVLEYLEGVDLATHAESRGPLSIADVVGYVLQACEAIAEAHAANVVHRDLKPANLFLAKQPDRRSIVKVLDFGISKIMGEPMTTPSALLGTVLYMSPEQLRASSLVDARTDIWALGVILYELLAGVPPFDGVTIVGVAEAVRLNAPTPLRHHRSDVPPALENAISRCLRTDPAERHASVLELAVAIAPFATYAAQQSVRSIAGVLRGSIAPPPPPPPRPPPPPPPNPQLELLRGLRVDPVAIPPPLPSDAPLSGPSLIPPPDGLEATPSRPSWTVWVVGMALAALLTLLGRSAIEPPAPAVGLLPPAVEEITLRMSAANDHARVRIDDGAPHPLPFDTRVPRDHQMHRIVVEAEGFLPRVETVGFQRDLTVRAALEPLPVNDAGR